MLFTQKQVLGHSLFPREHVDTQGFLGSNPPPTNLHHHDSYMFSRECQSKPLFATVPGGNFPMRFKFFKLGCAYRDKQISKWHGEQRVAAGCGWFGPTRWAFKKGQPPFENSHFFFRERCLEEDSCPLIDGPVNFHSNQFSAKFIEAHSLKINEERTNAVKTEPLNQPNPPRVSGSSFRVEKLSTGNPDLLAFGSNQTQHPLLLVVTPASLKKNQGLKRCRMKIVRGGCWLDHPKGKWSLLSDLQLKIVILSHLT